MQLGIAPRSGCTLRCLKRKTLTPVRLTEAVGCMPSSMHFGVSTQACARALRRCVP